MMNLPLKERLAVLLATCFGLGLRPKAPGTFGSLAGLPVSWLCAYFFLSGSEPPTSYPLRVFVILFAASMFAYFVIRAVERLWQSADDQRIVIDEVVGVMCVCLWFKPGLLSWGLAFGLFRFFDILKPPPIGWIDRYKNSWATLLDDIAAGFCAALVLFYLQYFFPSVLF
jgi:phosphatidylglycerophosphatase A